MRELIVEVIATAFGRTPAETGDDPTPQTLEGWDSLRHLELVLELEMRFGVRIPTERVPELTSVTAIEHALQELAPTP
jgi:acyl carrier protein